MTEVLKYRIVIVGVGAQGSEIVDLLCDLGHQVVGAVDIGAKVGQQLTSLTTSAAVPGITVRATISEALDELAEPPDIIVIAASLAVKPLLDLVGELLDQGINVITLHSEVFARDDLWAAPLHERAVAGGASFMATGVQDTWWVQLPTLVASSSLSVRCIRISSTLSLSQLSASIGQRLGIGLTADEFSSHTAEVLTSPGVLGAPLIEAARRMGAVASEMTRDLEPVIAESGYQWESGGVMIPAGRVVGTRESLAFDTDRGIRFEGIIEVLPIPRAETADELHVIGLPEHHLRYQPFPGHEITNVALVARIPDVVAAAPGVLFAADLAPASHQLPKQ